MSPLRVSTIVVRVSIRTRQHIEQPVIGVLMRTSSATDLTGSNTLREDMELPSMEPGETHTADFHLHLPALRAGCYTFTPAIADGTLEDFRLCDMVENAAPLWVVPGRPVFGLLHIPCITATIVQDHNL